MDELELLADDNRYVRDSCVSVISETWLHPSIPDTAVQLVDRTIHSWDRNQDSGKSRGGGLCIFVHNNWSTNTTNIDTHCSPDLEYITVKCRPFFLPRELTEVLIMAVYIPLPSLKHIYISRCLTRAERITKDSSHSGFHLFHLMPYFYGQCESTTSNCTIFTHLHISIYNTVIHILRYCYTLYISIYIYNTVMHS